MFKEAKNKITTKKFTQKFMQFFSNTQYFTKSKTLSNERFSGKMRKLQEKNFKGIFRKRFAGKFRANFA